MPPDQVTGYLEEHCEDTDLRQEVRTFLRAFHLDSAFLDQPVDLGTSSLAQAALAEEIREGASIGPFRLVEKLGEGGMGEVFKAVQEHPIQRTVALKLIRQGLVGRQALLRFDAERQTLALMNHPNIARIYEAGEGPRGRPYVVMEYLEGPSITEFCDTKRLTLEQRLELFDQILQGIRHAHQKGVIHRDLKPGKLLVVMEDRPVLKIIDFGIAKVHAREDSETPEPSPLLTEPGQWLGTPDYMSPEQAGGARGEVDVRSDLYSLGAVLYELLCGRRPLALPAAEVGLSALLDTIRRQEPSPPSLRLQEDPDKSRIATLRGLVPSTLQRRLQGDLDFVVLRALAKDPADRYESAQELAEDLRRYRKGAPLLSSPSGPFEHALRWVRRHRLAASIVGLFLLSLLAGVFGTTHGLLRAQRAELDARAQADRAMSESRRAQEAAASAQQITDFLLSVLKASDPIHNRKLDRTLREVIDESARRVREELIDQPLVQAQLMLAMSYSYKSLGNFEQARRFGEDALARFQEHPDSHGAKVAEAHFATSEAYFELGRFESCLHHLQETLRLEETLFGPEDVRLAKVYNNLGMVYRQTKKLEQAREVLERALQLRERGLGPNHLKTALTLDNLGLVLHDLGEHDQAASHLERSLRLHEEALGPQHPKLSYSLNNLALVRKAQGDLDLAQRFLERAVLIDRQALGDGHLYVAIGLYNLGDLAETRGDCEAALDHYAEARTILENSLPADHWRRAEISKVIDRLKDLCSQT